MHCLKFLLIPHSISPKCPKEVHLNNLCKQLSDLFGYLLSNSLLKRPESLYTFKTSASYAV